MAITISANPPDLVGKQRQVTGAITFDASYPTGGEALTPAQLGLTTLTDLRVQPGLGASTTAYVPVWNRSTSAPIVLAFLSENSGSDGPLIQVTDETDLSGFTFGFVATGF